jgi:hypothetical protein
MSPAISPVPDDWLSLSRPAWMSSARTPLFVVGVDAGRQ